MDFEIGRILRQILERALYRELGFESFADYVVERLDLSPRTARRLVRLARAPEAADGFREGRITLIAVEAILRGAPLDEMVTLRKLQEQVRPEVDLWAPPDVARLFLAMVARGDWEAVAASALATEGRNLRAEGGQGCAGVGWARLAMESHVEPSSSVTSALSAAAQRAAGERSETDGTTSAACTGRD